MISKKSFLLVLLLTAFLGSCGQPVAPSTSNGNPQASINETSVSTNTVAEEIYLNNCGNSASSEQISERSQTVTIEAGAEVGISAEVIKASVEGKYIETKGIKKSQTVTASPGTNMKFVLLWTEDVKEGVVTASGHSGQAGYRVNIPISVEQASADDLGCPTNGGVAVQPPTQPPVPTSAPVVSLDTAPGSILHKGEYWRQNDISLIMDAVSFDTGKSCAGFDFDLTNNSDHDLLLTILLGQFSVKDNTGRTWQPRALSHYVYCGDAGPWNDLQISVAIGPGKGYWDGGYTTWIVSFDGPLNDSQVTSLYITVNGLSQFAEATWEIPLR